MEERQVMTDFKVLLMIRQERSIFFLLYSVHCLHSQPPVLSGPAGVWSCIVWVWAEVWRHMTRVVRHRVAGRRRDVGVEVGAWVGPVGRRRGEDAGCNEKCMRINEKKINIRRRIRRWIEGKEPYREDKHKKRRWRGKLNDKIEEGGKQKQRVK
jgi:hypothetical protein